MMICVIEAKYKCVWGIGETPEAAMAHAREVINEKNEKIRPEHSDLSFAQLSPDADLRDDGQSKPISPPLDIEKLEACHEQ